MLKCGFEMILTLKKTAQTVKKGTNGKYISILSGIALINGTKCHLYEVTVDFEDYRNEERHLIALSWPCKVVCCTFCPVALTCCWLMFNQALSTAV